MSSRKITIMMHVQHLPGDKLVIIAVTMESLTSWPMRMLATQISAPVGLQREYGIISLVWNPSKRSPNLYSHGIEK